jgi:hypothetical protein
MHKRVGANSRKHTREKRKAVGSAFSKALKKGMSASRIMVIAVLVCGGGVFAAVKVLSWMKHSPVFTVAAVRVEGTMRVNKTDAVQLSGIKPGMRMMELKPRVSEKSIAQNPWVRRAHVLRQFPSTIVIKIEERTPIALVNTGRICYMDNDGVLLPLFAGTYTALPVVSGFFADSTGRLVAEDLNRVKRFLAGCNAGGNGLVKRISQIDFSRPGMVRMKIDDVPAVVEMSEERAQTSAYRLGQLVESEQNTAAGLPKRINLCYENLAYVQR